MTDREVTMRWPGFLVVMVAAAALAAGPASQPATAEDSSPTLLGGKLEFDVPEGWAFVGRSKSGETVAFRKKDTQFQFSIQATPHPQGVPQSARMKKELAEQTVEKLKKAVSSQKGQIVQEPKVEADERVFVRIRHQYKLKDILVDQVLAYRAVGPNLLMMWASAQTEDAEQAKAVHDAGIAALLSVRVARGGGAVAASRPADDVIKLGATTALRKAGIRVAGPQGWKAQENDNASGIVISYRNPENGSDLIAVTVRPVPAEVKKDNASRQKWAEQMAAAEKASFKAEGAEATGKDEVVKDARFLRKVRTRYTSKDMDFVVELRQVLVGDALVGVTSVATDDRAEQTGAVADRVATEVRGLIRPGG